MRLFDLIQNKHYDDAVKRVRSSLFVIFQTESTLETPTYWLGEVQVVKANYAGSTIGLRNAISRFPAP